MSQQINPEEVKVEAMATGIILVLLAGWFFLDQLGGNIPFLLAGLVLLGSAIYQTRKSWHVSLLTWVLGVVLTAWGIGVRVFLVSFLQVNYLAVTLLLLGVYLLYNNRRR